MKHSDNQFTIEEVERLCQLYQDCQLSILEETELEYVLTHNDFDSQLIKDTKELMTVSRLLKPKTVRPQKSVWSWAFRAAASVAIALSAFTIYNNIKFNHQNDNCIVYVAGEKVSSEKAHNLAEADVLKMQEFIQTVNELNAQEESKVEKFMNQINPSR